MLPFIEECVLRCCFVVRTCSCQIHAPTHPLPELQALTVLKVLALRGKPEELSKLTVAIVPTIAGLRHLQRLNMSGSRVTDAAVPHIALLTNLRRWRTLQLSPGQLAAAQTAVRLPTTSPSGWRDGRDTDWCVAWILKRTGCLNLQWTDSLVWSISAEWSAKAAVAAA